MTDTLHADISNQKKSEKDTTVEIIIPVLNEENTIRDLLQSIRSVRLPVKISTLVIDGGSEDRTIEICKQKNVKVINQKG
ncbi:MAG: glycosyltransferase, partial [Nitrosopumilaceae archaeon]